MLLFITFEAEASADDGGPARLPAYFVRAAFENSVRDFADTESAPGAARTYHAAPIPGFALSVEAYPLLGGLLGLDGSFAESVGLTSTTSARTTVDTAYVRAEGALKARLPLSTKTNAPWLSLFAGYGYTGYTFGAVPPGREIPSARYNALRFGVDGRLRVNRFHFTGAVEYDHLITIGSQGTLQGVTVSPQTPGYGVTGKVGAGFALVPWFVVGFDGRLQWITYDYARTPSADATDRYLTLSLSVEALF